jgi:hypothetical protein
MILGLQSVKETNRLKSSFGTVMLEEESSFGTVMLEEEVTQGEEEIKEGEEEEIWTPPFHFLNSLFSSFLHQR